MKIGFDFGSKNINYAVLNDDKITLKGCRTHNGNISGIYNLILDEINEKFKPGSISTMGLTGNFKLPGTRVFDPVIAAVEANRLLDTRCRNIISIGCESFYLIRLDENFNYLEHFVNSDCASGTGSFIDQQAERLGFTTEALSEKAFAFKGQSPSIATRCAVFAKSDIIHSQAQGFSKEAIAAGLCEGVARSVISNTLKGRTMSGPVIFTGGMSKNRKIVKELSCLLERDVLVHDESLSFNAIGAALSGDIPWDQSKNIVNIIRQKRDTREPLSINLKHYPDFNEDPTYISDDIEITLYQKPENKNYDVYIGIDVGSTSTKAIITDTQCNIIAGLYGRTKGDPVKAVTALFAQVRRLFSDSQINIVGVATTGSGRDLLRDVTNADFAINEITAHAKGSVFLDPEVDTIIEIGGQDSKFTQLRNQVVTNATMNYVCAAGTGSFIEEQAKRLDMTLGEISESVPGKTAPYTSDRCTVYMERDLNIFLSEGWKRDQIIAAVLYSVRDNYLSKVMGKSRPGKRIYFQGATARNKALVAVFENELNQSIYVSKYCHLTGAIGCAVSLMEKKHKKSSFSGIDFSCTTGSETCTLCTNRCDLRLYTVNGKTTAWGLKCGRNYNDKKAETVKKISSLEKKYNERFKIPDGKKTEALTIGIPYTLFMVEHTTLFKDFFQRLGFNVVVEKSSGKKLSNGMKMLNADFCAPMALSHGIVESLSRKKVDYIFMPTLINEQGYVNNLEREALFKEKETDSYFCYYSSYAGTIIDNLPGYDFGNKLLIPKIKFNNTPETIVASNLGNDLAHVLKIHKDRISEAFIAARQAFLAQKSLWINEGNKVLESTKARIKILLLGRPYALFDQQINLGIPYKLEQMGFELITQSMLQMEPEKNTPDHIDNMHWYFGQQILLAMEAIKRNINIYPVFLTCFRCSPDAYLMNYFKEFMEQAGKPYLILQLDEHSSDVGYMTRIEAAVDTFINDLKAREKTDIKIALPHKEHQPDTIEDGDTILIPLTDRRINRLQKAVFEVSGFKATIVELDKEMLNQGYRYVTGGECLPNVAIVGSLINHLKKGIFDQEKTILYLPNLCLSCNFNQYGNLVKLACKNAGFGGVRIMNTNGLLPVSGIPARSNAMLLSATILSSILSKLYFRYHPYETVKGSTDALINQAEEIIIHHILNKKSLFPAAEQIRDLFKGIALPKERKPRVGILGDMYAKYNTVLNDSICEYTESLGGEILLPSYNELVLHAAHADVVENRDSGKIMNTMVNYEHKFEQIFAGLLDDAFEPNLEECRELMTEFGLTNFIAGETTVSMGRMLYYIKHGVVDAVIHVNPVFCCPGVISSSLFRKIQERYDLPIIDLFYDGTNKPNRMIDPHMYYLEKRSLVK